MAINQVGDTVRLETTFKVGTVLTDPTTVTLAVRDPLGVSTTYTYAGATITRDSVGAYSKNIVVGAAGIWAWLWTGTGAAAGVDDGTFTVAATLLGSGVLCSVDDVKMAMESDATATDDLIQTLIVSASRTIVVWTGREFAPLAPNPSTRTIDVGPYGPRASSDGIPIGDLQSDPSAVALIDSYGNPVSTYVVATDIQSMPLYRLPWQPITTLRFRNGAGGYSSSGQQVQVTGSWGWPQIPAEVAHAAVITVRSWLRRDSQAWAGAGDDFGREVSPMPSGGWMLPIAAKQILGSYRPIGVA